MHVVIETLLSQKIKPDRICLWLSEFDYSGDRVLDPKKLPKPLVRQKERGLEVLFCKDMRSYGKLIPALRDNPESVIVTADDDVLYPNTWLGNLYSAHKKHKDMVICYRGSKISFSGSGELLPYTQWPEYTETSPSMFLFPTGRDGILYPPNTFNEEVFNESRFMSLCPTADDIWFKAMALYNNKECMKLSPHHRDFTGVRGSQKDNETLHYINNVLGKNDQQFRAVINAYGIDLAVPN